MTTVTYNAPKGDDKVVEFCGVEFYHAHPVDLEAEQHEHLLKKARTNPHFVVAGEEPADEADEAGLDRAKAKGAKAKADGKQRRVPPAYAGKPEGDAWLAGYDSERAGE